MKTNITALFSAFVVAALATPTMGVLADDAPAKTKTAAIAPKSASGTTEQKASFDFDAAKGQLPEGLHVTKDALYVGIAGSGEVWKIARDGTRTLFGATPAPVAGKGFLTGVTLAPNGDVIAALASFTPEVQPGLYRIPKSGGKVKLFAQDAKMTFPNGLAYVASGDLLVTDSTGVVFRVSPKGKVTQVVADDLLKGDKSGASSPAATGQKFGLDIGVNGIAVSKTGQVWVVNSDKGSLLRFTYNAKTGKAGALETVVADGAKLGGADGLALTAKGEALVALNTQDKIVKVTASGIIQDLPALAAFDFPASIVRDPSSKGETFWVTNAGFLSQAKKPGIVRVTLD